MPLWFQLTLIVVAVIVGCCLADALTSWARHLDAQTQIDRRMLLEDERRSHEARMSPFHKAANVLMGAMLAPGEANELRRIIDCAEVPGGRRARPGEPGWGF